MPILLISCSGCGHETPICVGNDSNAMGNIICDSCKKFMFKYRIIKGYVYLLSNPLMPNVVKIGITNRLINERVRELGSNTGVPAKFKLEACFYSDNPEKHEKLIHSKLSKHRVKGKEFFNIDIYDAIIEMEKICGGKNIFNSTSYITRSINGVARNIDRI